MAGESGHKTKGKGNMSLAVVYSRDQVGIDAPLRRMDADNVQPN